jgi:thiol-disulfide isomerase/thioredoxin
VSGAPAIRRRTVLLASGACAALGTGVGWALWQHRHKADGGVWALAFDRPAGGRLALSELRGKPWVLNFWATWCPPCVREMPALDRFARDFKARGWRVVGLAADREAPVREFLTHSPVSYDIGLAGFAGIELSRQLGNLSGGLPFTVLYGRDGSLLLRHMGETRYEQLAGWAEGIS